MQYRVALIRRDNPHPAVTNPRGNRRNKSPGKNNKKGANGKPNGNGQNSANGENATVWE